MRTITSKRGEAANGKARWVRVPHELHRYQMEKRAGRAYRRTGAGATQIAEALGLRSHASGSRRAQGQDGPLAPLLLEISAMGRADIDTMPILEAVIETILEAQGEDACCLDTISRQALALQQKQEAAHHEFLRCARTGSPEWRRALVSYVAHAKRAIRCLAEDQ